MAEPGTDAPAQDLLALAAALLGAAVLWFARDVMSVDVALRVLLTLLWLGLWSVAAYGVGAPLLRRLQGRGPFPVEDLPLVLLAGAGLLSVAATYLALAGLFRSGIIAALLLAAAAAGLREVVLRRAPARPALPDGIAAPVVLTVLVAAALIPVLSAPPVMYDVLNYHLAFPQHWLDAGRFVEFPRHGFSYYPSSHGMLYAYALATVGPWGANALHFWFAGLATAVAAALGARVGGARAAAWAAAAFALTPAVLEVGPWATADLAVAAWGGGALAAVLGRRGAVVHPGRWALAGLLLGSALAAKYLALAVVLMPWSAAAALLLLTDAKQSRLRSIAAAAAAAAVPLLPWLVRNLVWTGNPLYPYLRGLLGGPLTEMGVAAEIIHAGETVPGTLAWAVQAVAGLALRTFGPLGQGGLLGPHWLMLLPVALALWALRRQAVGSRGLVAGLWAFTAVGLLAWGSLVQMARFLLPVLVVGAALAGHAAATLTTSARRSLRWSFSLLLLAVLAWNASMIATRQNLERLQFAAGQIGGREYMERWVSYAPLLDHLNGELPAGSRVLFVAEPRSMYVEAPVVVEDPMRMPLLVELATRADGPDAIARQLADLGITHLMVNTHEMKLSAGLRGEADYWGPLTSAQRATLDEFFRTRVVHAAGDEGLWIGRLTPPRPPPG